VLNVNTKNMMKESKMTELTLGCYYDENTINENVSKESGLNVWRGYKATIAPYNNRIFLQVDVCSRVLRDESFLVTLEMDRKQLSLEEINVKYAQSCVLMKYGNLKVYKIESLEFKMNPKNKFYYAKEGKEISYVEYFQTKYGYKVKNEGQPLVKVLAKKVKFSNKLEAEKVEFIYIIPEMLTLTGLSDAQRSNFKIMKSLDPYTKLSPQRRMAETAKMIEKLQDQEELLFKIKNDPYMLEGYQLEAPEIKVGGNKKLTVKNGSIMLRDKVLEPHIFKNYFFCYSAGKDAKFDQEDADYAIDQIKKASETFGIKVCEPYWIEVNNPRGIDDWRRALETKKDKEEKIDVVIYFLKPFEEKLYGDLKKLTSTVMKCPSQIIKRRSLSSNTKGVLSFASKIILQMNSKIGHPLWSVPNYHPHWKGNKIAIAGIASSKGKKGTTIGFVATTNSDLTHVHCDCKKIESRDGISSALFQGLFTPWLQNYFMKNQKVLPTTLVIYREGLNDVQARHQFEFEVQGLLDTINVVRVKTKNPNYNPSIAYLLVNKKPNSRIYEREGSGKTANYENPAPGSVIFEDLSKDGYREFHLASVLVNQGSCTPVEFKIGYESKDKMVPLDALAELTYNQCYCYFNWTGAVRVPASLQYANKLSKQCSEIGEDLMTEEKGSDLKSKPFFL
jgi:aubergine-like protein